MYKLIDYYENPLGEVIFETNDFLLALSKAKEFQEDTGFECSLKIEECDQKQTIIDNISKEVAETAKRNAQKIMKNY